MPFTDLGKNELLNATLIRLAGLFNGIPGAGGVELTGGSPAYARRTTTPTAAAAGQIVITADATFDVPPGATVNHVGYYNAAGTVLLAYDDVTEEVYAGQGEYILDSSTFAI